MAVKLSYMIFNYDSVEEMNKHIEYMVREEGATLYEADEEYLYAEFQFYCPVEKIEKDIPLS